MKYKWEIAAGIALVMTAGVLFAAENFDTTRVLTIWTARAAVVGFIIGFAGYGIARGEAMRSFGYPTAAFAMALHLIALIRKAQLLNEPALSFGTPPEIIASFIGAGALSLVLVAWFAWNTRWYRYAAYVPWLLFLLTYLIRADVGASTPRILDKPWMFGPVVAALLIAFVWRGYVDTREMRRENS